jgi:hypothetical protein
MHKWTVLCCETKKFRSRSSVRLRPKNLKSKGKLRRFFRSRLLKAKK